MNFESFIRRGFYVCSKVAAIALASFIATSTLAQEADVIVSTAPMEIDADGTGAHGQLPVAPEILNEETADDLIYTITVEPEHGRVGLAGGDDGVDIFDTKSSRFGYFAYRPEETYDGTDSFSYTVRNETSGPILPSPARCPTTKAS